MNPYFDEEDPYGSIVIKNRLNTKMTCTQPLIFKNLW